LQLVGGVGRRKKAASHRLCASGKWGGDPQPPVKVVDVPGNGRRAEVQLLRDFFRPLPGSQPRNDLLLVSREDRNVV
jgi:hypothetical protein